MVRKIRVSRNGLTQCPGCAAHIKMATILAETTCPFCNASLSTLKDETKSFLQSMSDSVMTGRSALIAASLMGLTACGNTSSTADTIQKDTVVEDIPNVQPYGIPPDILFEDTNEPSDIVEPDIPAQPPYGIPPDDIVEPEDTATPKDTAEPDIPPQPPYGIPPDDIQEPPEPADTSDASNSDDASDATAKDIKKADAPLPAPVYGAPPSPKDAE